MKRTIIGIGVALAASLGTTIQAQTGTVSRTFGDGGLPQFLAIYDLNGDGSLSAEERAAMQAARDQRHVQWIRQWDTNADGVVSSEERQGAQDALKQRIEDARATRFTEADLNADGHLSFEEFRAIPPVARLAQDHPAAPRAIFDNLDANDDNQVSAEEFAQRLRQGERPPLERQFQAADTNADGFVSLAEFSAMPGMVRLAAEKPDAPQVLFTRLDVNADGQLTMREFLAQPPPPEAPAPKDPFDIADVDDDGFLSFAEFSAIPGMVELAKRNPAGPQQVFDRLDANGDQKVSPLEFLTPPPPPPAPPTPEEQFKAADANADGSLDLAEFSTLPAMVDLAKTTPGAPKQIFDRHDANADEVLSLREFLTPPAPPTPPGPPAA